MTARKAEYTYVSDDPSHTAGYLWPAVSRLIPAQPCRICDIGCGNGWAAAALADLGHDVLGLDSTETGIEIARARLSRAEFDRRSLYDPVPDTWRASFDVAVSLEVVEHLYFPRELPRVAHELLRPGGLFIVSTPYHGYLKNVLLAVSGRLDEHFTALWDHGHIKFFSHRTLRHMLEQRGFKDVRFSHAGRLPLLWKSMVASCRR